MNGIVDAEVPIFIVAKKPFVDNLQVNNQKEDKTSSLYASTLRNRLNHRTSTHRAVLQDVPLHFSKRDD